jgi:hypothetical protein
MSPTKTGLRVRPAWMAELDEAAANTARVMASTTDHDARIAAAAAEEALYGKWLASSSEVDAYLQREAEAEAG